jgi:hypothetical protein
LVNVVSHDESQYRSHIETPLGASNESADRQLRKNFNRSRAQSVDALRPSLIGVSTFGVVTDIAVLAIAAAFFLWLSSVFFADGSKSWPHCREVMTGTMCAAAS